MSYANGPKIVTDGLVLCLDAANRKSYPGTGTAWNDLSGNNKNASLINGVSYSSANNGYFSFDGTNDYGKVPSFNGDSNNELSVFAWVNSSSETYYSGGNVYINWIANKRDNGTDRQWQLLTYRNPSSLNIIVPHVTLFSGSTTIANVEYSGGSSISGMTLNQWHYVGFTTSGVSGGFVRVYLDGVLNTYTTLSANRGKGSRELVLATPGWDYASILRWNGNISNTQIYNRALSDDEIRRNYNATKGRFGL